MQDPFKYHENPSASGVQADETGQPQTHPLIHEPTEAQYQEALAYKVKAVKALERGEEALAETYYKKTEEALRTILRPLRFQLFSRKPTRSVRELRPVKVTDQSRGDVFRFIEADTCWAELQMKFGRFKEASEKLESSLKLPGGNNQLTADSLYNLGMIYKLQFEESHRSKVKSTLSHLEDSSWNFIGALLKYREFDHEQCEGVADKFIDNIRLMTTHTGNDEFTFDRLPGCEQKLLIKIIAEILTKDQLDTLSSVDDESRGFFVTNKWQHPVTEIADLTEDQIQKIRALQQALIPGFQAEPQESANPASAASQAENTYTSLLSMFGNSGEALKQAEALMQEAEALDLVAQAEEERARIARVEDKKLQAEADRIEPELAAAEAELAEEKQTAIQTFLENMRKDVEAKKRDVETKKREREKAEESKAEHARDITAKKEKLAQTRQNIETINQFKP